MKEVKVFKPEKDCQHVTLGGVIEMAMMFPEYEFKFSNSVDGYGEYWVGELASWRGAYNIPSLQFSQQPIKGAKLSQKIKSSLKKTHCGYKGGKYTYREEDEFYVAHYGSWSNQEKVDYFLVYEDEKLVVLHLTVCEYCINQE